MRRFDILILAAMLALVARTPARAQHAGDMEIGATGAAGGALLIDEAFNFDTVIRVAYSTTLAGTSIYTATDPGFEALEASEPPEIYALPAGTDLSVELTAVDAGKAAIVLNAVTLDEVGESVLLGTVGALPPNDPHQHPTWTLLLMLPEGSFGEARVCFKLTTTAAGYTESAPHCLRLSNGHLAPPDYDTTAYDAASVRCQQHLGKQARKLAHKASGFLVRCLDKVAAVHAREAAGLDSTAALAAAERACGDAGGALPAAATMLGKIAAVRTAVFDKIKERCGPTGSADYDDDAITQHLGLVLCRVEDMMAAAYHEAHEALEGITDGGTPVIDALPCLVPTSEAD
jgi:hypothetical protein